MKHIIRSTSSSIPKLSFAIALVRGPGGRARAELGDSADQGAGSVFAGPSRG